MKSVVAVYLSHSEAVKAVESLKDGGYKANQISLITKANNANNKISFKSSNAIEETEIGLGMFVGAILGTLTGVGLFMIPGLGILYGAGAVIGIMAGLEGGIIASSITVILTAMGINQVNSARYERHLNDCKFLVIVQGDEKEVEGAKKQLYTLGSHLELE
jgi:uncharacterized membrane protein